MFYGSKTLTAVIDNLCWVLGRHKVSPAIFLFSTPAALPTASSVRGQWLGLLFWLGWDQLFTTCRPPTPAGNDNVSDGDSLQISHTLWLCVWDGCTIIFCHLLHIYPGNTGTLFPLLISVYGICKWSDTLWPVGRVRLFADYTISLSSLCRLIWKHWTTKMLVRYMMPSVCLRLRQFSQLSLYSLYGAVCLQLTQLSCDDRENVYFILLSSSNRKYESLTIV